MTEAQAQAWMVERFGEIRTATVGRFLSLVIDENQRQNLVSPASIAEIWSRHAIDSAQLVALAEADDGLWLDIGTGGGFPGMVVAILRDAPVVMVEPRKRRVEFIDGAIDTLGLTNASIVCAKVEQVDLSARIISARAVASVEKLLQASAHCATPETRWILPRGRLDPEDVVQLRRLQRGKMFHVEHSLTNAESSILIVEKHR
ncbi:MAG: 16S rRNA (guanine(527)-N(7))-methyltransferase RsmG [Sphingomonas bacterium]|nr:16S rRNA (guanine(527)-N(7))-methyltransferase RsmG [Sphingomonas bacterium]